MKIHRLRLIAFCLCLLSLHATATTYYVDINSPNPTPPYTSWSTAATNIQDAISETVSGDVVLVNPGVYQNGGETINGSLTNRVAINQAITVESVDGPSNTIIKGYQTFLPANYEDPIRCVYMTNNSALIGFTLTGGSAGEYGDTLRDESGGGVWCESTNGILVSNCVISANFAYNLGGGAYQGTLVHCTLLGNQALDGGGVAGSLVFGSLLISNTASGSDDLADGDGGGAYDSTVLSSAIAENGAQNQGGGAYGGTLINCDVIENAAFGPFGEGGGTASSIQTNCIIYYNKISSNEGFVTNTDGGTFSYCCTLPYAGGFGVITNDPDLADISHISLYSPCRGAGNPAVNTGGDLDGNPWGNPPSIGCSEIPSGDDYGNLTVAISTIITNLAPGFPEPFQADILGPVYTTVWNFGDGTIMTNQFSPSHSWAAAGTYAVTLTAYNDSSPTGLTATLIMTIANPGVYYVNLNNEHSMAPYSTWAIAATNIEDAVNIAVPGSLVLVTNGAPPFQTNGVAIYQYGGTNFPAQGPTFNRVGINRPITVQSVNGPSVTCIAGGLSSPVRCVYITNGAVLSGFTIINGVADTGGSSAIEGGGIYAASTNCVITNCVITRCLAIFGGGVYSGTLYNCIIRSNVDNFLGTVGAGADMSVLNGCELYENSTYGNGAAAANSILNNCALSNNAALSTIGSAAFECLMTNCTLTGNASDNGGAMVGGVANNCFFSSNSAAEYGGAVYGTASYPVVLNNCTLSNNVAYSGGGVYGVTGPNFTNCILNNCFLTANHCFSYGGAASSAQMNNCVISNNWITASSGDGGGVEGGLLSNCLLIGNYAFGGGGGLDAGSINATLNNCTLAGNTVYGTGGGVSGNGGSGILNQCTLSNNVSSVGGGAYGCVLNDCAILQNVVTNEYGYAAEGGGAADSALNNCLIISNTASTPSYQFEVGYGGGAYSCELTNCILAYNESLTNGGAAYESTLVNCTVAANTASLGGGVLDCHADNCILYNNNGGDYYPATTQYPLNYCCDSSSLPYGIRNITNAPLFINLASGDYHLQSSSPCINSGNNAYITSTTDLDGNPRIVGGTADIGAYEYQTPTSVISYAYLQQYDLSTDGSVDFKDLDGTAFNVYQDWVTGLNPTNPASILAMLTPVTTNTATGVTVTWQSVSGIPYFLQRSTNLVSQPPFSTIQNNIIGQTNTTTYTDTAATNNVPYLYRVGVTAP